MGGGGLVKFTKTNCKCLLHAVHSTVLVVIDVRREEDCLLAATGERASRSCPHLVPHYFQGTPCIWSVSFVAGIIFPLTTKQVQAPGILRCQCRVFLSYVFFCCCKCLPLFAVPVRVSCQPWYANAAMELAQKS